MDSGAVTVVANTREWAGAVRRQLAESVNVEAVIRSCDEIVPRNGVVLIADSLTGGVLDVLPAPQPGSCKRITP